VLGTVGSPAVLALASPVVAVGARQEEGLVISQFGEAYEEYRGRTKAIIPRRL